LIVYIPEPGHSLCWLYHARVEMNR
jgi:hypothetical protein